MEQLAAARAHPDVLVTTDWVEAKEEKEGEEKSYYLELVERPSAHLAVDAEWLIRKALGEGFVAYGALGAQDRRRETRRHKSKRRRRKKARSGPVRQQKTSEGGSYYPSFMVGGSCRGK